VRLVRCAIYTRKSSEEGLEQEFNSLDAQREAGEAYVRSQAGEGWALVAEPSGPGSSDCWPMLKRGRSTASWSTRWTD
jgi:DNA invertase Pin-like site-specific DNA recombinase